jgi:hypothetical protein
VAMRSREQWKHRRCKDFWIGSGLLEDNSPTSCVLLLLMAIDVVLPCPLGLPLPVLLYPRGLNYKEGNRVGYDMVPIRTLSLLACFTYISIDMISYALGTMSWSSGIFWILD